MIVASDLHTKHPANKMSKYADDTYLMVGSSNIDTISEEFANIRSWATLNNLRIHPNKTKEMIIYRRRNKRPYHRRPRLSPELNGCTQCECWESSLTSILP